MSKAFQIYTRKWKESDRFPRQISFEWYFQKGGYCAVSPVNFVFCHRFAKKGVAHLGSEKEFIFRFEAGLDREPKISWFTLEAINTFEARWYWIGWKLSSVLNFRSIFNFGWRVSKESRAYLGKSGIQKLRTEAVKLGVIKPTMNGGQINAVFNK